MSLVLKDRVRETTITVGTGTVTLAGAVVGYQSFTQIGNANTTYYCITNPGVTEWEVGIGTYTASGTALSRDTVLESSNGGSLVNFSAGIKDVFVTYPADKAIYGDASNNVKLLANLNFSGTGNRITGDFSNATLANRVMFQTSTVNGQTSIGVLPNGTSTSANLNLFGGADPANASIAQIVNAGSEVSFRNAITGTGTSVPMTFYTGGSERVRVDTSGNVGIGTSSPVGKLHINSANESALRITSDSTGSSSTDGLFLGINSNGFDATIWNYENGYIRFATNATERMRINSAGNVGIGTSSPAVALDVQASGGAQVRAMETGAGVDLRLNAIGGAGLAGVVGTYSNHPVVLYTNSTERARIDSSGNLLVGSTTQVGSGKVGVNFGSSGEGIALISSGTSDRSPLVFFNGNGFVGRVSTSGSNTAYLTSSDHRLKDNVQPMTGALSKVAALKPCTYRWKADGSDGEGFIAHELAEVVPQCVAGDKDAVDSEGNPIYQGIDTSFLVATLTAALQEAHGLIKDLQSRVQALENA